MRRQVLWTVGIVVALVVALIVLGYVYEWRWTGLVKDSDFSKRTLWDWLELLIVPAVLALGGYLFTRSENRRTQEIAEEQRNLDRQIAIQRQQDDALQAYLDGMAQLLTDNERPFHRAQLGDSLSTVARARTLTVLIRLNGIRKGSVLRFLYESGLVARDRPVLDLRGADLREAWLHQADLRRANLRQADLQGTNLSEAHLPGADLREADLRRANLSGADLSGADLSGANVTQDQLDQAASLEGATMPNGQKYEDWLKNKSSGEDEDNNGA